MPYLAVLLFALCVGTPGLAGNLDPGDIFTTDSLANAVVRLDGATGSPEIISSGDRLLRPNGITIDSQGEIFVTSQTGEIVKVDPMTGAQTVVASGLQVPSGISTDGNDDLIVTTSQTVVRIDRSNGQVAVISSANLGTAFVAVDVADDGQIFVTELVNGQLIRVDPTSGSKTVVASGLGTPNGIAVMNGEGFVTHTPNLVMGGGGIGISRVNLSTGNGVLVPDTDELLAPVGITFDGNGFLLVADFRDVIRINPVTGARSVVNSELLGSVFGIAAVPVPEPGAVASQLIACISIALIAVLGRVD